MQRQIKSIPLFGNSICIYSKIKISNLHNIFVNSRQKSNNCRNKQLN